MLPWTFYVLLLSSCTNEAAPPEEEPSAPDATTLVPVCLPDESVRVLTLELEPTPNMQARVAVTLSARADVAVVCTLEEDPSEVHLLEGIDQDQYSFQLGGLLADADYACTAVASCPTSREAPVTAALHTLPAPAFTPTATARTHPSLEMTGAYTLTNAQPDCTGGPDRDQWLVIWDPQGRPRWLYTLPPGLNAGIEARWHGGDTIVWGGGADASGSPAIVDLFEGELYKTEFPGSSAVTFHHDGKQIPDGRILTTEESLEQDWASFQLRLVEPETGEVGWYYHSDQAVAQGALTPQGYYDSKDPWHLNWADVVGQQAIVSLCHAWTIAAIDIPTSQVTWKFGMDGDFRLVDPQGAALSWQDFPQCQHGLEYDGESLLVYDNGSVNRWSRATEYTLDPERMVATKTWEWSEPGWFETSMGDVDWLTDDHQRVLVTQAHPECFSPSPGWVSQIVEVDKESGEAVHRLIFDEDDTTTYRAERLGGCDIFRNAALCDDLAKRLARLETLLD
jgi:hypothetical protein